MAVIFHIPAPLRPYADRHGRLEIQGQFTTLDAALAALWQAYPKLRDRVVNEQGEIRKHINIFVGDESARELSTPVTDGVEISIFPAITGGS